MTNYQLLNNIDHHDLRVITRHAAEFGDAVNQVLVFPTEFEEVQREYPILIRRNPEGGYHAVALLGLDRDENLFLDEAGWDARYVPALQQRGPFLIGMREQDFDGELRMEPMIHVDLDHPRIGKGEGEPVFLPQGGNAPHLERVSAALRVIHVGSEVSGPMFAAFEAEALIEPVAIEILLDDAQRYVVPDAFTIGAERLAALDGAALERLHRGGFLRAAFHIAASLANVQRLADRKNRRQPAG